MRLTWWQQVIGHRCGICGRWMGRSAHQNHPACAADSKALEAAAKAIRLMPFDGPAVKDRWLAVAARLDAIADPKLATENSGKEG